MPRHVAKCATDDLHRTARIHATTTLSLERNDAIDPGILLLKFLSAKPLHHITRNGV